MTQMGMDVEAVESVGRQLKQSAAAVDPIVGTLDKTVSGLAQLWDGPDAQRLIQSWPTFRKSLVAAQASIAGLGQSALNNASEQRQASGARPSGGGVSSKAIQGGGVAPTPTDPGAALAGGAPSFDATQEQAAFNARAHGPFGPGGDFDGQCTSWVNFRRGQLEQEGLISGPVPTTWQDHHFYPGAVSSTPMPYSVGSFSSGAHTFIVESVSSDSKTISVSEMNVGAPVSTYVTTGLGHVSSATYEQLADGRWQKYVNGKPGQIDTLTFGA